MKITALLRIGDTVDRIIGILGKLSLLLLGISDSQKALAERYIELTASHDLLRTRYDELAAPVVQQQATNAELYSNIIMIAQAIKAKGIDVKFPVMEFETKHDAKDPDVN